jgi:hypothetical protein
MMEDRKEPAMAKRPDYEVFVSEKNGDKIYYHKVGAAWNVASDGISVRLSALPIDGSLVLFPPREKAE